MQYTSVCRFLGGDKFSVLLGKYRDTIAGSYEYARCCCLVTQLEKKRHQIKADSGETWLCCQALGRSGEGYSAL